ncbi:hypothetical protein HPB50_008726 [Hyalomma asiaticum]|uniref:Uncharacterized protein n=1 Tax=Hyalomma asiaticum TaxID=266040 RepID=A0ACB7TJD8_HYAAI|nr:hypothetical protein HPB50_008726 [Hyalomma asiaticum]
MLRITGSKCHSLYRFLPSPEHGWQEKIMKLLTQNFAGNDATRHGKACEKPAIEEYASNTRDAVFTAGLVINPVVPWLGFSPDGIVFRHGKPAVLLEIKSPMRGKTETISDLVNQKKEGLDCSTIHVFKLCQVGTKENKSFSSVTFPRVLCDLVSTAFRF